MADLNKVAVKIMQLHHEEPPVTDALKPYISRCLHTYSEADSGFCMALPPTGVMYLTFVYGDEMTLQFGGGTPRLHRDSS